LAEEKKRHETELANLKKKQEGDVHELSLSLSAHEEELSRLRSEVDKAKESVKEASETERRSAEAARAAEQAKLDTLEREQIALMETKSIRAQAEANKKRAEAQLADLDSLKSRMATVIEERDTAISECDLARNAVTLANGQRDLAVQAETNAKIEKIQEVQIANESREEALEMAATARKEKGAALHQAENARKDRDERVETANKAREEAVKQADDARADKELRVQAAKEAREQAISARDTALGKMKSAEKARTSMATELSQERQAKNEAIAKQEAALAGVKKTVEESVNQQRVSVLDLQEALREMEILDLVAAKAQADLESEYSEAKGAWETKTSALEDENDSLVGQNTELLIDILGRRKVFRDMQDSLQRLENGIDAWKQQEQAAAYAHYFAKYVDKVDEYRDMFMSYVKDHVDAGGCPNCPSLRTQLEQCSSLLAHFQEAYGTETERNEELANRQGVMEFEYDELEDIFHAVAGEAVAGGRKYRQLQNEYTELESVFRMIAEENEVLREDLQNEFSENEDLESAYLQDLEELQEEYSRKLAEVEEGTAMIVLWQTRRVFRDLAVRNNAAITAMRQELSQMKDRSAAAMQSTQHCRPVMARQHPGCAD
jgi:hypothetical protein